jgi:aspartate aminotransferase
MGLYGERCGAFHVFCKSSLEAKAVTSNLEIIIRPMYSSPPKHGAAIASKVLTTPELYNMWQKELLDITERIASMRKALYDELTARGTPGTWEHVVKQKGMFTYTGLSRVQSIAMVDEHHVYMLSSGRISVAGLGTGNVKYVADCIDNVVRRYS